MGNQRSRPCRPGEIAAEAVRDELYARAAFARLISLPPRAFRAAVESDSRACTEFMARHILDFIDDKYDSLPPEHQIELVEAARAAARDGELHVRCRVEKDVANSLRYLGRFAEAECALQRADLLAAQTSARGVHAACAEYGRAALIGDRGQPEEATERLEKVVRAFEENGAYDRAYSATLYDAVLKYSQSDYLAALRATEDAARVALHRGPEEHLARAYVNVAHCFRGLGEFTAARRYFAKGAKLLGRCGSVVLEAKALRCAARMSIRLHGESGIPAMERAKNAFLALGMAGEVCRCNLAIIEELFRSDARTDLTGYCRSLADEALALGVMPIIANAIEKLTEAAILGETSDQVLLETWNALGPTYSLPAISAAATVEN